MAIALPSTASPFAISFSSSLFCPQNPLRNAPLPFCVGKSSSYQCNASKKPSFVEQILDYIEGGPKLRKWYGAPDLYPKDGSIAEAEEDDDSDVMEKRDAILVTDGDSDIGQMVILSLIVKKLQVKALVKDKRAAMEAFGNYVEALAGDANSNTFVKKALRGVRAVICPKEGFLSKVDDLKRVEHVVLLSQLSVYEGTNGIQALMKNNSKKIAEQDELILLASGTPYTIIRAGSLENTPGGVLGYSFQEGSARNGRLSKEDAAFICVEALDVVPESGLVFEVVNGEEEVTDWKQQFMKLMGSGEQEQ